MAPDKAPYLDETVRRMVTTTRTTMADLAFELLIEGMQAKSLIADTDSTHHAKFAKGSAEYEEAKKVMDDRFKKSGNVVDLILTKLPNHSSPYALQMGERLAKILYALGEETGNKQYTAKANKIIESELLRFAQYARYYQSLTPSQYRLLSNSDMYVDTYYIVELLQTYNDYNEGKTEAMMKKMEEEGADLQRLFNRYPKGN